MPTALSKLAVASTIQGLVLVSGLVSTPVAAARSLRSG